MIEDFKKDFKDKGTAYITEGLHPLKKSQLNMRIGHEALFRSDDVYDVIIEIKYNIKPIINGKGSAIFIHCSFDDLRSTKGCIAIHKNDLIFILKNLRKDTILEIF